MDILSLLLKPYIDPAKLIRRYDNMKIARDPWNTKWQMIQDQVFPDYRDYQNPYQVTEAQTAKIKNHSSLISGKINKVVSLLSSQMCDPSVKWLDLSFGENVFNEMYETQAWLHQCTDAVYRLFADPATEFYQSTYSFHLDWFSIGNACRHIQLRRDNGHIQFTTVSMQDIFIETSGYGDIDTIFRRLNITARQAYTLWGDSLHPQMLQYIAQSEENTPTPKKWEFFEAVIPNPLKAKIPSLNYMSVVIDKMNKHIVDVGLHAYSPYVVSRFFVAPGETYGRSYVWNAMPDIVAINRISKRVLQGVDFATLPITLVKDATSINQTKITPGGFIQGLDEAGRPTFQQLQYSGNIPLAMEAYTAKLNDLDEALVARDIFPAESVNMTATEVNERKIQASNRMRPILVRLEAEDLNKTILRTLKLLEQTSQLPTFPYSEVHISPEQLPDPISALRVRFSGQMAKMQKLQDIVNSDMLFQKAVMLSQVYPQVFDRINVDQLLAEDAKIYGVAPGIINSDEVVQQIREERAKQQEQQAQQEQEAMALDNLIKLKETGLYGATDQ